MIDEKLLLHVHLSLQTSNCSFELSTLRSLTVFSSSKPTPTLSLFQLKIILIYELQWIQQVRRTKNSTQVQY